MEDEARIRVVLRSTRMPVRLQFDAARRIARQINDGFIRSKSKSKTNPAAIQRTRRDRDCYPDTCICSITLEPFCDPVVAWDGHTYERVAIEKWLEERHTSPMLGISMPATLIPNLNLRIMIDDMDAVAKSTAVDAVDAAGD